MNIQQKTYTILYTTAVGLVVTGLCFRFGGEKFLTDYHVQKYNDSPSPFLKNFCKYSGVALYIGGWLILSICLYLKSNGNKILKNSIFSILLISIFWSIFEFKEENFMLHPKLPLISCSVLLSTMVTLISLKYKIKDIFLIVMASLIIVISEWVILPFQRHNNISDGLGIPLMIFGWFLLFYVFNEPKREEIKEDILLRKL